MSKAPLQELNSSEFRAARRFAVQFLYQLEITDQSFASEAMFETFCVQLEVPENLKPYLQNLVTGVLKTKIEIDKTIEQHLKNWKMNRVAKVDLCILRVCLYELKTRSDVSKEVIISDAAEIGKLFGAENTSGFVNGVLDSAEKTIRKDGSGK